MSENTPQNFGPGDLGGAVDKAKDYAKDNPDQVKSAIDQLEQAVNDKTGGKYQDVIEKGGDFLEKQFGIPSDVSGTEPTQPDPTQPEPGQPTDPSEAPQPPEPTQPEQPQQPSGPSVPEPTPDQAPTTPEQPSDPSAPEPTPDQAPATPDKTLPPFGN